MTPDNSQHYLEEQRQHEEQRRNERRFLDYNDRRQAQGLEPLPLLEQLKRLHHSAEQRDLVEAIRPVDPTHRDKIRLFTR